MRYKLAFNTYPFAIIAATFLLLASGNLYRALKPLDTRRINTPQDVSHEAEQRGEIVGKAAVQLVVFLLSGYALSQSLARFAPSSPATRVTRWFFVTPIIRPPSVSMVPRNWIKAMRMKRLAFFMVIFGVGLFVYGVVNFLNGGPAIISGNDYSPLYSHNLEVRLEASTGAMLMVVGLLFLRDSR